MGPHGDDMSVVDSECRVKGVERLRVIDASCMPTITSGNTNAPTVMLAQVMAVLRITAVGTDAVASGCS
jgi:choline dehydrogenase